MTTLTTDAVDAIRGWARQFNPAAGQVLIDAAARSPYLTSQFNQFVATRGEFAAPAANSASAERLSNGNIRINVGTQLASNYLDSPVAKDQLATVFAHEMGHALSPGGMPTGTVIPTQAVESSRRAEGVALTSEMIVGYQLSMGRNGKYSYSDGGGLNQPAGALAQQFSQQIAHENDAVSQWTFDSTSAKSFVNYSVSPIAQTYGLWSGQARASDAPKLTYDQRAEAWAALNACGPENSPLLIDWRTVEPGAVTLNSNPDGSCRINTPRALPRRDGSQISLNADLDSAGHPVRVSVSVDMQGDGMIDQTTSTDYTYSDNSNAYQTHTTLMDRNGNLLSWTIIQTSDDGSRFEYKTEGGNNYIQTIDEDGKASGWKEYKTPAQERAVDAMYIDMTGFVNALRGKYKVNQLLYAAKIGINYQISQGNTQLALGEQVIKGLVPCANDNSWRVAA